MSQNWKLPVEREREKETDRQTDRERETETDRQAGRQAGRQTDRDRETQREKVCVCGGGGSHKTGSSQLCHSELYHRKR